MALKRGVFGRQQPAGAAIIAIAWGPDLGVLLVVFLKWYGAIPVRLSPPVALLMPAAVTPLAFLAVGTDRRYQSLGIGLDHPPGKLP